MNTKKLVVLVVLALSLALVPAAVSGQAQKGKVVKKSRPQAVNPMDPVLNFEHVWKTIDRNYGQFQVKHVDWDALYRVYRPLVATTTTDPELWDILLAMMGHLNDRHLCLADGKRRVDASGGEKSYEEMYASAAFSLDLVKSKYLQGKFNEALGGSFVSGWLAEGVGYLYIGDLKDPLEAITKTIDAVMAEFARARVMVVDVRKNPGGTLRAVDIVAGRFADRPRRYGTERTRYGPKHDDFWPDDCRHVEPGGPLQFTGPTVLLTDRVSASAAEGLVLAMRVLPQVTVLGDITEGALSSQFPDKMPNGWTLWVAFRELRDQDGVCWDGVGIPPDLRMLNKAADIAAGCDRVLEFAIKLLEKGAAAPQDEAKSLVDVKKSLADEYVKCLKDVGLEAAVAMLERERKASDGKYFFTPEYAIQQANLLLARRQYSEALGMLSACRESFPEVAVTYAKLALAYLGLKDIAAAEAVMKEGDQVEPMLPFERPEIEQARLALRKAKLGSAAELFGKALAEGGVPAAEKKLKEMQKRRQDGPVFEENDFNNLGYQLLQEKKLESAIYVFETNARLYPESWNTWDSLGEAAAKVGQTDKAIASYRKSLELNPRNKNGQAMLDKLLKG
jgi:tetratricopeptide (TPR) repeat protein